MYLLVLSSDALNSHRTARHLLTYSTKPTEPTDTLIFFSAHLHLQSTHLQHSPTALTYSTRLQHSLAALTYSTRTAPQPPHRHRQRHRHAGPALAAPRPPLPCPRGFGTAFGCGSLYSAPHRNRRTGTGTLAPRLPPRAPRCLAPADPDRSAISCGIYNCSKAPKASPN